MTFVALAPRPHARVRLVLAALLSLGAVACGGIALIDDGGSGGNGTQIPPGLGTCADLDLTADVPIEQCLTATRCELRATFAGVSIAERCENGGCTLVIDGDVACTCPKDQIDFASTCGNGVPTCHAWKLDWTDVTSCSTP